MTNSTVGAARIRDAFASAKRDGRIAFVPYIVAEFPDAQTSERLAVGALDAGADLMEVGLPYSDPLADGVTLQRAGTAALANGASLDGSLALVERIATARPDKPVLAMGYANQFMGPRGAEFIAERLSDAGAAGAIVPDLPVDEGAPLEEAFEHRGIALVYLVAPTSSGDRIELIASRSGGFVYCVSLAGVTGARRTGSQSDLAELVGRVKERSPVPVGVGFGVSRPEHVRAVAATGADAAIVGSALTDALGPDGTNEAAFLALCAELAAATAATL
jgi:tryptophan synthase alpha chain